MVCRCAHATDVAMLKGSAVNGALLSDHSARWPCRGDATDCVHRQAGQVVMATVMHPAPQLHPTVMHLAPQLHPTGITRIRFIVTWGYLFCLGLRGDRERDPGGGGVGAEGLGLQVPPHLVLAWPRHTPLTLLRPLRLLVEAVPIDTHKLESALHEQTQIPAYNRA